MAPALLKAVTLATCVKAFLLPGIAPHDYQSGAGPKSNAERDRGARAARRAQIDPEDGETTSYSRGVPVGYVDKEKDKIYVYNHVQLIVKYHETDNGARVVGVLSLFDFLPIRPAERLPVRRVDGVAAGRHRAGWPRRLRSERARPGDGCLGRPGRKGAVPGRGGFSFAAPAAPSGRRRAPKSTARGRAEIRVRSE